MLPQLSAGFIVKVSIFIRILLQYLKVALCKPLIILLATDGRDIHLSAIRWIIQHWSWASVGLCHYRLRSGRLCFRHCRHCNHRLKVWVLTPLLLQGFLVNCSIPATSKPAYQQQADAHPIIPTNTSQTITDPRPIPRLGPRFINQIRILLLFNSRPSIVAVP